MALKHTMRGSQGCKEDGATATLNLQYSNIHCHTEELWRELAQARQELSRLKLLNASTAEAKEEAEKKTKASTRKVIMCSGIIHEIKKEIEQLNEELVLVELARIEAERGFHNIQAQRMEEAAKFAVTIAQAKKRLKYFRKEAGRRAGAKELQKKLEATTSDVNVLQSEMALLRAKEERSFHKDRMSQKEQQELKSTPAVAAAAELEAARKELASINDEGFQYMASMDHTRRELLHIANESEQLANSEKKTDSALQFLNSKLLKAKSKLASAVKTQDRTEEITSNLSAALQKLQTDIELANKETEQVSEEMTYIKTETTKRSTELTEAKLQAAVEELADVKRKEALALSLLKTVSETTMKARTLLSKNNQSHIKISKFEYEYLRNQAKAAKGVADKKVAAAQAWVEAIETGEQEMLLRADSIAHMEFTTAVDKGKFDDLSFREKEVKSLGDSHLAVAMQRGRLRGNGVHVGESRTIKTKRSSVSLGRRRSITHSPSVPSGGR